MLFTAPWWLLALIPWVAVSVYLLIGRSPRVGVPFVELWRDSDLPRPRASRSLRRPPLAIALLLAALLLAIGGAAGLTIVAWDSGSPASSIAPRATQNVALVYVSARATPAPAVMLTVRNDSDWQSARVRVTSAGGVGTGGGGDGGVSHGGGAIEREIQLPARGQQVDVFFDLAGEARDISVELLDPDDIASDNRAQLTRRWPAIEVVSPLPAEVERIVSVYAKHRPPSARPRADEPPAQAEHGNSGSIIVTDDLKSFPARAAAIVAGGDGSAIDRPPSAVDHPLTRFVQAWPRDAMVSSAPPGEGWTPLVTAGDRVLVAVREAPHRQVWTGFRSPTFAGSFDFAIFWTNALDWIAEEPSAGGAAGKLAVYTPDGYIREGNTRREYVSSGVDPAQGTSATRPSSSVSSPLTSARINLAPWLLVASVAMLAASIGTWRRAAGSAENAGRVASAALA